jgi:hypothetical protein
MNPTTHYIQEPELGDQLRDRTRELLANAIALCVGREGYVLYPAPLHLECFSLVPKS